MSLLQSAKHDSPAFKSNCCTIVNLELFVRSLQLLQDVLGRYSIPAESFASVCVIVDKVSPSTLISPSLLAAVLWYHWRR